jgi:thiamine pyrophosphate-dependent acetolactate synthase large subunit-like protein
MLLGDIVELNGTKTPDRPAIVSGDRTITFGQLRDAAPRVSNAMLQLATPGDRIGILAENIPEYVECYYGVPGAGMALTFLNYRLHPKEWTWILNNAEASVLIVQEKYLEAIEPFLADIPTLQHVLVIGAEHGDGRGRPTYADVVNAAPATPPELVVDVDSTARVRMPAVALVGDAAPILRALIAALGSHTRPSRHDDMVERQAKWRARMAKLAPQIGFLEVIRAALGEDGILMDEVTQLGFAARILYPVYKPRTFISPGYQDSLGWGYATALGVQHACPDKRVLLITGDGGFLFTATEMATAMHHRIPLVAVVFNDSAFGNVRRIQQERYGNRVIASDLTNPDFVRFAESFGAAAERARTPEDLRAALGRAFRRRDVPTLIEVPAGPLPSPWEFINMPRVRG